MKTASVVSVIAGFIAATGALPVVTKSRQDLVASSSGHENEAPKAKRQGFSGSLGGHDWFKEEEEVESPKTKRQGFSGSLGGHDWFKEENKDVN
ncbi:hypothetical protein ACQKWADRAFT_324611 [Trichoderma austrokoningii]